MKKRPTLPEMIGLPVQVYKNLHLNCWSIRHKNKIIAHTETLELADCVCHVGQSGRERVLQQKQKNVHAWIRGTLLSFHPMLDDSFKEITYSPYFHKSFIWSDSKFPITLSEHIIFTLTKVWAKSCTIIS